MSGPDWRIPGSWNPLEIMRDVGMKFSGAAVGEQVLAMSGFRSMMQQLLSAVSRRFEGKRLAFGSDEGGLQLTLLSIDADLDPAAAGVGQVEAVSLAAEDITWGGRTFSRGTATLRNVHVRPGTRPQVLAAPVDVSLWPDVAWLSAALSDKCKALSLTEVDGLYTLVARYRRLTCRMSLEAEVEHGRLVIRPAVVELGGRRSELPMKVRRALSRPLAWTLPEGARLRSVAHTDDGLRFDVRMDEWRLDWDTVMAGASPDDVTTRGGSTP